MTSWLRWTAVSVAFAYCAAADGASWLMAAEEPGHESGPPLSFKTDLAMWYLISFLLLLFILRKFAWTPLIEGLDKRESNILNALAEAEAARAKAEQMLREHTERLASVDDEVKAMIEEARRDAERTKQDIVAAAQKEAQTTQDRAIHEIERARDQALKELFDTMAGQVASATEHVLGRALSGDDQNRLIDEALSEFSSRS